MSVPYLGLAPHAQALQDQGFRVVSDDGEQLVAVRSKWHWEVFLTKLTWIVAVYRVGELSAARIRADREGLTQSARELDPSVLPRGLQKGMAVMSLYIADRIDDEARTLLARKPELRFAWFHVPAALDRSSGEVLFVQGTPLWGAAYYGKIKWLAGEILTPGPAPGTEPLSKLSCGLCGCMVALVVGIFLIAIIAVVASNL